MSPALFASAVALLAFLVAGCGTAGDAESPAAAAGPASGEAASAEVPGLAGTWVGLDAPRNPAEARLLGCSHELWPLERQLAAPAVADCVAPGTVEAVEQGREVTLLPHAVVCRDGLPRTREASATVHGGTLHGRLDLVGNGEVRTGYFSAPIDGARLRLALDRLEVSGLSSGTCLVEPPLRLDVSVVP